MVSRCSASARFFSAIRYASSSAKYSREATLSSRRNSSARSNFCTCFSRNLRCGESSRRSPSTSRTFSRVLSSFLIASCFLNSYTLRPSASSSIARRSRGAESKMRSASPWEIIWCPVSPMFAEASNSWISRKRTLEPLTAYSLAPSLYTVRSICTSSKSSFGKMRRVLSKIAATDARFARGFV